MCLAELERVEMGDRGKRDEYRRSLTFDDDTYDTYVCFGSLPVPLFHEPSTQFFCPIDCVSDGDKSRMR